MPELTEYQHLLQRRKAEQAKSVQEQRRQYVVPRVKEIAYKAQTVVDHPGWQYFLDSLETRIKEVEKLHLARRDEMIFGKAMGQDLERLKIELNTMDAEMRALRFAQALIPQAIAHGNDVVAGVNTGAAAQSIAG